MLLEAALDGCEALRVLKVDGNSLAFVIQVYKFVGAKHNRIQVQCDRDMAVLAHTLLRLQASSFISAIVLDTYHINDDGAMEIAAALRVNNNITELRLANTGIQRAGVLALFGAILNTNYIQILNLSGNEICFEGAVFLRAILSKNNGCLEELFLAGCKLVESSIGITYYSSLVLFFRLCVLNETFWLL